jgi:phosphate transport system substrate-binding protein
MQQVKCTSESGKGVGMILVSKHRLSWLIIGTLLVMVGVVPSAAPAGTAIKIGGTGSALGTMKQLAEAFEKSHPGIIIQILPSLGSSGGIKALLAGGIDVALSSRTLTEDEQHQGAIAHEYAKSPFVFITNSKVNKKNITTRELEEIYGAPAASWPDGSRIRLVLRPEKDVDSLLVRSISPGLEKAVNSALARHGMIMAITDQESSNTIAKTPGSLGCATLTEIISENRPVNILALNGVQASVKAISNKSYPLVKSLYLVTTAKTSAEARQFIEFVRSPDAARVLTKNGNLAVAVK